MNILVVSEEYYPTANANVNCLDKVIKELTGRSHSVTVLTQDYNGNLPEDESYQDWRIHRLSIAAEMAKRQKLFKPRTNRFSIILEGLLSHLSLIYLRWIKILRAKKWIKTQHFDRILSVANPVLSHDLACGLANKKMHWFLYNLDPYVFNSSASNRYKARMRTEKRWSRKATGIIDTFGIQRENAKHNYFPYKKQRKLEVALPNCEFFERSESPAKRESDPYVLRYTGMFYEDIRRPDELLKVLALLDPERYVAEFYGSCCDYLRTHFKELPPCVRLMGSVSIEECRNLVETADILVNVGNTNTNQVPSKIFEYISTGKPILNLFSTEAELSLEYLRKYPSIVSTNTAQNVTVEMIESLAKKERIPVETIRTIYQDCLQENIVDSIADFIEAN